MKRDVRFLGVDDGPFHRGDPRTRLVGVVTRGSGYVEGVLSDWVEVDGSDATQTFLDLFTRSRFRGLVRAIFFNGVCVGGFNVLDVDAIHDATGRPVLTISRDPPDPPAIRRALRAAFDDWEPRWRVIERSRPVRLRNGRFTVWATCRGVTPLEATRILQASTVRGSMPEALRLAHVIASGVERGESGGQV